MIRFKHIFLMFLTCMVCQSSSGQHQPQTFKVSLYSSKYPNELCTDIKIGNSTSSVILDSVGIDTGCTGLYLNSSDYDKFLKLGIISKDNFVGMVQNSGITNIQLMNKQYKIKNLQIGNVLIQDVIVTFGTCPQSKGNKMRLLGMQVLKRFDSMSIDFNNNTMYLYKY